MTDTIKPAAWIHAVTNGEDEDYALSFAPDNFPLNGIAGFKSVDVQPLYTQAAIDAAIAAERAESRHVRRLLAVRVGMPHTYYDDGEAQGQEHGISIDFMREPVADIDAKLRALNVARAEMAAARQKRLENFDPSHAPGDGA